MVYQYDVMIVNRKYREIVQRFGASSQYAQPYTSRMIQMGAKRNKQGILQLPVYKKDIARYNEKEIYQSNINAMRKLSSAQDIRKRITEQLKRENITPENNGQYSREQITERATLEDEIKDIITELKGVAYNGDEELQKMLKGEKRGGTNKGNLTNEQMIEIKTYYNYLRYNKTIQELPFD